MKKLGIILGLTLLSSSSIASSNLSIEQLQEKAQQAMVAGDVPQVEKYNTLLVERDPNNRDAAYRLALSRSWQPEKMDQAATDFESFLRKYPRYKDAWLAYARLQSWRQHYSSAFSLLETYKNRFGITPDYLSTRARVLLLVGYYNQALAINTPLLTNNPNDFDLLNTHAIAHYKARHFREARQELATLKRMQPKRTEIQELEKLLSSLRTSVVSGGFNYYKDSEGIKNWIAPFSLDWALNDNTHFLLHVLHENLRAEPGSGYETIDGHTSIYDDSFLTGIQSRIIPSISLTGMAGGLQIEDGPKEVIYLANANFILGEKTNLDLLYSHNLYRPYLYPPSPKEVSLGIIEDLMRAKISWQPYYQTNIPLLFSYSSLSDGNHYTHLDFVPTKQFNINTRTTITLGAEADLLDFEKDYNNGYYDPNFHQEYLGILGFTYSPNDNVSATIQVAGGAHRDQTTGGFQPSGRAYAGMAAILEFVELEVNADYTYQGYEDHNQSYEGISFGARLGIRF